MDINFFNYEVERFIANLDPATYAKSLRMIGLLEKFGDQIRPPYSKKIHEKTFELRIRGKQEVRILYSFWRGTAVLLHAFFKKTQTVPARDIALAKKRLGQLD